MQLHVSRGYAVTYNIVAIAIFLQRIFACCHSLSINVYSPGADPGFWLEGA